METFFTVLAICAGNSPSPVNSPHKGQWRGALMYILMCAWINGWVNNGEAGDLRRHRTYYDVTVMLIRTNVCKLSTAEETTNKSLNISNVVINTVPIEDLTLLGARASAGTVTTRVALRCPKYACIIRLSCTWRYHLEFWLDETTVQNFRGQHSWWI